MDLFLNAINQKTGFGCRHILAFTLFDHCRLSLQPQTLKWIHVSWPWLSFCIVCRCKEAASPTYAVALDRGHTRPPAYSRCRAPSQADVIIHLWNQVAVGRGSCSKAFSVQLVGLGGRMRFVKTSQFSSHQKWRLWRESMEKWGGGERQQWRNKAERREWVREKKILFIWARE